MPRNISLSSLPRSFNQSLLTTRPLCNRPDQKAQLERLKTSLDKVKTELDGRLGRVNQDKSKSATEVNRRASILCEKIDLQAPPPPPMNIPNAPAPPPGSGPTRASRPVRSDDGARASTLLSQIRRGKDLNKIDLDAVKRERQQGVQSNRASMALLSSLQETLRQALNFRQDNMNLYGSESEEGDWED